MTFDNQSFVINNAEATSGHSQRFLPVGIIIREIMCLVNEAKSREGTSKIFKQE